MVCFLYQLFFVEWFGEKFEKKIELNDRHKSARKFFRIVTCHWELAMFENSCPRNPHESIRFILLLPPGCNIFCPMAPYDFHINQCRMKFWTQHKLCRTSTAKITNRNWKCFSNFLKKRQFFPWFWATFGRWRKLNIVPFGAVPNFAPSATKNGSSTSLSKNRRAKH